MLNTVIFFLALLLTYGQLDMWLTKKDTKEEISGLLAVICWSILYYLTH